MPSLTRSATMGVPSQPTSILTEMPPVNFLKSPKISLFNPILIYLFRNHFSAWIDTNRYGNRADFVELYKAFRDVYKNHIKTEVKKEADKEERTVDPLQLRALDEENDALLNQFWEFVMGMGQLASCFDMSSPGSVEQAPESSSKGKKEIRRYNHVLAKIVATSMDPKCPGPWDIPKQARGKLPDAEGMMLEMFVAMKNNTDVLDYFDTKPYKDHWHSMTDKDFWHLSTSLFKHLNDLHQGRDFVEGFRYVDRYHSLVSLLKNCKGTIYFMSRPSTYEDVLLNPHMMELRFADNQKNNAKKKLDNRELAARRAQEFFHKNGTDPPPRTRTLRGAAAKNSRNKRTISEVDEDEIMEEEEEETASLTAAPSTNTRSATKRKAAATAPLPPTTSKRSVAKGKGKSVPTTATASAKGIFVPPVSTEALVRATTHVQALPMVGLDPKRAKQLESGKRQKQQYQHFQRLQEFNVKVEVAPEQFGEEFVVSGELGTNNLDPRLLDSGPSTVSAYHGSHNQHRVDPSGSNQFYGNNHDFSNVFLFGSEEEEAQGWTNNGEVARLNDAENSSKSNTAPYNQTPDQEFVQNILNANYETVADTNYSVGQQNELENISIHHTPTHTTVGTGWHNAQSQYRAQPADGEGNPFFDFDDSSFGPDKMAEMEKMLDLDHPDPNR